MPLRHAIAAALASAAALSLAACSSDDADAAAGAPDDTNSGSDSFPVEIEHALGTTTIPEKPERVASVAWGNQDVALALGIAPVGTDAQVWNWTGDAEPGLYEWTTQGYSALDAEEPEVFSVSDGLDFEAISDTDPDIILAGLSGLTEEDYDTLSQIAPVVAYPENAWYTPWRDQIALNAQALGLEEEGQQLVEDLDEQISDAAADAPEIEGKTAAFFYMNAADLSSVSLYTGGDPRTAFLEDLGFEMPQSAIDAAASGSFYVDVAEENVDELNDVDVIVSYGDEQLISALEDDPLWGTVPAVQNGSVVAIGEGDTFSAAVSPTALSIPWVIEDYVELLNDAAANAQ